MKPETMDKKMQSISHNIPEERPEPLESDSYTEKRQPPAMAPDDMPAGYVLPKRKRKPTQDMKQALHTFRFLALILAIPLQAIAIYMLGVISEVLVVHYVVYVVLIPGTTWFVLNQIADDIDTSTASVPSLLIKKLWEFAGPKHGN